MKKSLSGIGLWGLLLFDPQAAFGLCRVESIDAASNKASIVSTGSLGWEGELWLRSGREKCSVEVLEYGDERAVVSTGKCNFAITGDSEVLGGGCSALASTVGPVPEGGDQGQPRAPVLHSGGGAASGHLLKSNPSARSGSGQAAERGWGDGQLLESLFALEAGKTTKKSLTYPAEYTSRNIKLKSKEKGRVALDRNIFWYLSKKRTVGMGLSSGDSYQFIDYTFPAGKEKKEKIRVLRKSRRLGLVLAPIYREFLIRPYLAFSREIAREEVKVKGGSLVKSSMKQRAFSLGLQFDLNARRENSFARLYFSEQKEKSRTGDLLEINYSEKMHLDIRSEIALVENSWTELSWVMDGKAYDAWQVTASLRVQYVFLTASYWREPIRHPSREAQGGLSLSLGFYFDHEFGG